MMLRAFQKHHAKRRRFTLHSFLNRDIHLFTSATKVHQIYTNTAPLKSQLLDKKFLLQHLGQASSSWKCKQNSAAGRANSAWLWREDHTGMLRLQLALAPEELSALTLLTLENQWNNKPVTPQPAMPTQLLAAHPWGSLLLSCLLHTHLCWSPPTAIPAIPNPRSTDRSTGCAPRGSLCRHCTPRSTSSRGLSTSRTSRLILETEGPFINPLLIND